MAGTEISRADPGVDGLVNCATQETSAQKTAWIVILLLTNFLGALLYSMRRKSPRP